MSVRIDSLHSSLALPTGEQTVRILPAGRVRRPPGCRRVVVVLGPHAPLRSTRATHLVIMLGNDRTVMPGCDDLSSMCPGRTAPRGQAQDGPRTATRIMIHRVSDLSRPGNHGGPPAQRLCGRVTRLRCRQAGHFASTRDGESRRAAALRRRTRPCHFLAVHAVWGNNRPSWEPCLTPTDLEET